MWKCPASSSPREIQPALSSTVWTKFGQGAMHTMNHVSVLDIPCRSRCSYTIYVCTMNITMCKPWYTIRQLSVYLACHFPECHVPIHRIPCDCLRYTKCQFSVYFVTAKYIPSIRSRFNVWQLSEYHLPVKNTAFSSSIKALIDNQTMRCRAILSNSFVRLLPMCPHSRRLVVVARGD